MASYLSSSLPSIQVILVLMVFAFTNPSFATGVYPDAADPDYYNDDVYYQLVAEYQDNLRLSAANKKNSGAAGEQDMERGLVPKEARQDENYDAETQEQGDKTEDEEEAESYEEMAARLNCDNPWFWNAFQCTWIDVKRKHITSRSKRNATICAWIIGSVLTLVVLWLCVLYCSYIGKARRRLKFLKLRKKFTPGQLELPSGKVVKYEPTEEEVQAYEELVKAIIIQEMALMI